jgi:hydroxyacylglutathione hydrolase
MGAPPVSSLVDDRLVLAQVLLHPTGDTLFVAGCCNFNSGTPAQMYDALVVRLGTLPPDTHVYAGHEYTLSNLRFAAVVEPENLDVALKLAWAQRQRDSGNGVRLCRCRVTSTGLPTVPSTIADELKTNPFMRVGTRQVAHYAQRDTPVEVMAEIRRLKTEWGRRK